MITSEILLSLVSSAFVLMIFSFLYRDNFWFHLASNIYICGTAAYTTAMALRTLYFQGLVPIYGGSSWYLLALIGSVLMFMRFVRGYEWLVRWPTAALVGAGIALNMAAAAQAQIAAQIVDTMKSVFTPSITTNINNLVIISGVCFVTLFFLFSKETKGVMKPVNRIGRCFLMVALGSSFAYALLGRTSLLLERFKILVAFPDNLLMVLAAALIAYDALSRRKS